MKKITKIEVSFKDDFVPFLRSFNTERPSRDVARIFIQESIKNLNSPDDSDLARQIYTKMRDSLDPETWVSGLFVWGVSVDGSDFWENVDLKWRTFLHKEVVGESEFVGKFELSDIESLLSKPIQGMYYTVTDLSYNRPAEEVFEKDVWNNTWSGDRPILYGNTYLVLSNFPESKEIAWFADCLRPMIKIWVPEVNKAWWVLYKPAQLQ